MREGGGDQRPFGSFPKKHPFWRIQSPLITITIIIIMSTIIIIICTRVWRIYSNIRIFEYFWSEYLFGYSFVSFFGYEYIRIFVRVNFLDTNIFGYSFVARFWFEYIRIFVRINFQDTNRFRRCFYWFSLDIILCLWIFCWYQWSKMLFRL